ncbi:MAG: MurR/RpiR family transcriptional regulator [Clostridia bacterium]|nr:MurR/RpiR family transcriptional regulator [Clostridia bacterium]
MNRTLLRAQLLYGEMGSSEKRIADYLLAHADAPEPMSITELAQKCNSSEATIVRFSRRLGFSGYQEFKISLAQESPRAIVSPTIEEADDCFTIFDKIVNDAYLSLERTKKTISAESLGEASELISGANRIVLIGLGSSASVAEDMAGKLLRAGCQVVAYSDTHMQAIAVSFVGPGDVVVGISHSGASKDIVESLRAARLKGAATICITGTTRSPIMKCSDVVLLTDTEETRHSALSLSSHIARQMVVDAICYHVVSSRSGGLKERYVTENAGELASKRVTE